jgi:hypothetical protein
LEICEGKGGIFFGWEEEEFLAQREMGENGEGEMLDRTERAPACPCHFPRVDNFDRRAFVEEEEEEEEEEDDGERNHENNINSSSSNGSSSLLVSPKEICSTLQRGQALQTLLYLETIDGEIEEVEREVALLSPLVQREVLRHSRGGSRNNPAVLPKQVCMFSCTGAYLLRMLLLLL